MSSFSLIHSQLLAFWSPGPGEMMVLAVVALLLYGGNLPEVARSWGKTFAEFRRGLTGFQSELNNVIYSEPEKLAYQEDNYRDDSSYTNGYEETDAYLEDANQDEPKSQQDGSEAQQDEIDDSEITVNETSAETIGVEAGDEKEAKAKNDEQPTD